MRGLAIEDVSDKPAAHGRAPPPPGMPIARENACEPTASDRREVLCASAAVRGGQFGLQVDLTPGTQCASTGNSACGSCRLTASKSEEARSLLDGALAVPKHWDPAGQVLECALQALFKPEHEQTMSIAKDKIRDSVSNTGTAPPLALALRILDMCEQGRGSRPGCVSVDPSAYQGPPSRPGTRGVFTKETSSMMVSAARSAVPCMCMMHRRSVVGGLYARAALRPRRSLRACLSAYG